MYEAASQGSARVEIRRVALLLAFAFVALGALLTPGFASAATITDRPLLFSFDGSGTTAGAFGFAPSIAVDQAAGLVYVVDLRPGEAVLDKFNLAGEPQDFTSCGCSSIKPFGSSSQFDVAVDNSSVNPGRIYLAQIGRPGPLKALNPSGSQVWQFTPSAFTSQVAVDPSGHPWIGNNSPEEIVEFASTGSSTPITSIPVTGHQNIDLGFDGGGKLFDLLSFGSGCPCVFPFSGGVMGTAIDQGDITGLAADEASAGGRLFTAHKDAVDEYESSGTLIGPVGRAFVRSPAAISYSSSDDRLYVLGRQVQVLGPPVTATVPDPTMEPISGLGRTSVTLNGLVNPQGVPNSYHFEWRQKSGSEVWDQASPSQSLPEDAASHPVAFEATGLQSNATYEARLVVTNSEKAIGTVSSAVTFTTLPPPPPIATLAAPTGITSTSALFTGSVDPQEAATDWRAQKSTDPLCESGFETVAGSEQSIPDRTAGTVPVSFEVAGLSPHRHYCIRIAATNPGGTGFSEVREFTTEAIAPTVAPIGFAAPREATSARLNYYLDPHGSATTYRFELSRDGLQWEALPDHPAGEGLLQIVASQVVSGLEPGTIYRFRMAAESIAGVAQGPERTFTTRTVAEMTAPRRGPELVNNPDKGNANVLTLGGPTSNQPNISADGEKAVWAVTTGAPGGNNGTTPLFLAERTSEGWRSHTADPPASEQIGEGTLSYLPQLVTPSLSTFVFNAGGNVLELADTLVRVDAAQRQEVLNDFSVGVDGAKANITDDGRHVVLIDPKSQQLVDVGGGFPEFLSLMPSGTLSSCKLVDGVSFSGGSGLQEGASASWRYGYNMMATTDASLVYFEAKPNGQCEKPWGLYLRNRETEETTLIDPGSQGSGVAAIRATPDGRSIYFTTFSKLSSEDTNSDADIYRWDEESGEATCLTCVVPDANVNDTKGTLSSAAAALVSDDFSRIYFISNSQLVPGEGHAGSANIYVLHAGQIKFVASSSEESLKADRSELSADGSVLVFRTSAPRLTADALAGEGTSCLSPVSLEPGRIVPCEELYRYEESEDSLECLSCSREGVTKWSFGTTDTVSAGSDYRLSPDGSTVAFATEQGLEPLDVNNGVDIYEWRTGGRRLLTDGVTSFQSGFAAPRVLAMSDTGRDVFFSIVDPGLTGFEQDGLANLYDDRIGGGFEPPSPPVHCSEESCQGPLVPAPGQDAVGSGGFSGAGNVATAPTTRKSCPAHTKRVKRRCVRASGKGRRHHSKRHKAPARVRGGSK
jgi:hypothetical protein